MNLYPNPAEEQTTVQFSLQQPSHVWMHLYDATGKEVSTLMNVNLETSDYSIEINLNELPKGVYLIRMISDFGIENQKLVVQ